MNCRLIAILTILLTFCVQSPAQQAASSPGGISKPSTPYVDMPGGNADENPRHAYGLNVRDYRGVRVLQPGGLRLDFGSLVRIVAGHRFAVIILTNKSNGLLTRSLEKATELVVPLEPRSTPTPKQPLVMTDAELKTYAGVYQNAPDYLRVEFVADGGKLFLKEVGASARSEVVKVGNNIFNTGGQEFLLIAGTNGETKYMRLAGHALKKMSWPRSGFIVVILPELIRSSRVHHCMISRRRFFKALAFAERIYPNSPIVPRSGRTRGCL